MKIKVIVGVLLFFIFQPFNFIILRQFRRSGWLDIPETLIGYSQLLLPLAVYLVMFFALSDILRLFSIYPKKLRNKKPYEAVIFLVIALIVCIYGMTNALTPKVRTYEIEVAKPNVDLSITFVSDLHFGALDMTEAKLEKSVEMINNFDSDLILFGGDMIDHSIDAMLEGNFIEILKQLKSKHGIFTVFGNHDYFGSDPKSVIETFAKAGIMTLKDDVGYIQPLNLYLIGRDDISRRRFYDGEDRKPLQELLKGIDSDSLRIVLDHSPSDFDAVSAEKIELQLSGHTHAGQFFPGWFAVRLVFPYVWGKYTQDESTIIVTSGLGSWGPPMRVGTNAEIVHLIIKSKQE